MLKLVVKYLLQMDLVTKMCKFRLQMNSFTKWKQFVLIKTNSLRYIFQGAWTSIFLKKSETFLWTCIFRTSFIIGWTNYSKPLKEVNFRNCVNIKFLIKKIKPRLCYNRDQSKVQDSSAAEKGFRHVLRCTCKIVCFSSPSLKVPEFSRNSDLQR